MSVEILWKIRGSPVDVLSIVNYFLPPAEQTVRTALAECSFVSGFACMRAPPN